MLQSIEDIILNEIKIQEEETGRSYHLWTKEERQQVIMSIFLKYGNGENHQIESFQSLEYVNNLIMNRDIMSLFIHPVNRTSRAPIKVKRN